MVHNCLQLQRLPYVLSLSIQQRITAQFSKVTMKGSTNHCYDLKCRLPLLNLQAHYSQVVPAQHFFDQDFHLHAPLLRLHVRFQHLLFALFKILPLHALLFRFLHLLQHLLFASLFGDERSLFVYAACVLLVVAEEGIGFVPIGNSLT